MPSESLKSTQVYTISTRAHVSALRALPVYVRETSPFFNPDLWGIIIPEPRRAGGGFNPYFVPAGMMMNQSGVVVL